MHVKNAIDRRGARRRDADGSRGEAPDRLEAEPVRHALVERVRRDIALKRYRMDERWSIALDRLADDVLAAREGRRARPSSTRRPRREPSTALRTPAEPLRHDRPTALAPT